MLRGPYALIAAILIGADLVGGFEDPSTGAETLWRSLGTQVFNHDVKLRATALLPLEQSRPDAGAEGGLG